MSLWSMCFAPLGIHFLTIYLNLENQRLISHFENKIFLSRTQSGFKAWSDYQFSIFMSLVIVSIHFYFAIKETEAENNLGVLSRVTVLSWEWNIGAHTPRDRTIYHSPSPYVTAFVSRLLKCTWRRQWQPTAVLLPGESHGWKSLVGCGPWGR